MEKSLSKNFILTTTVIRVHIPPVFAQDVKAGVSAKLNHLLLKYCKSVQGVVVAYSNLKLLKKKADIRYDCPFLHFDVAVDLLSFSPVVGDRIVGKIRQQSNAHIGLLVHGIFGVTINEAELTRKLLWDGHQNCWVRKSDGVALEEDESLEFKVTQLEIEDGVLNLVGDSLKVVNHAK